MGKVSKIKKRVSARVHSAEAPVKANAIELLSKVNEYKYQLAMGIVSAIITAGVANAITDPNIQYGLAKRS